MVKYIKMQPRTFYILGDKSMSVLPTTGGVTFCDLYCHSLLSRTGPSGHSESRGDVQQHPEVYH